MEGHLFASETGVRVQLTQRGGSLQNPGLQNPGQSAINAVNEQNNGSRVTYGRAVPE